jgi:hypothetical protein
MKFEKGKSGNPNGRPLGSTNKETSRFKEALNNLLEESSEKMIEWLGEIKDPKTRFDVLKDFSEYIHPKLARAEQIVTGADGGPVQQHITVELVKSNNTDSGSV